MLLPFIVVSITDAKSPVIKKHGCQGDRAKRHKMPREISEYAPGVKWYNYKKGK